MGCWPDPDPAPSSWVPLLIPLSPEPPFSPCCCFSLVGSPLHLSYSRPPPPSLLLGSFLTCHLSPPPSWTKTPTCRSPKGPLSPCPTKQTHRPQGGCCMSYLFPALGTVPCLTPASPSTSSLGPPLYNHREHPLRGVHLLQSLGSETLSCQSPQIQGPCEITLPSPSSLPVPKAKVFCIQSLGTGLSHCRPVPFSPSGPKSEVTLPLHPTSSIYESSLSAPTLASSCGPHAHGTWRWV